MRDHGYARYRLDGCRCYVCAQAVSEYNAKRERLIAYGRWQPYVDAGPVRNHVRLLMSAGIGHRTIVRAAGVSQGGLSKLLYGTAGQAPSRQVRPETAKRLLSLTPSLDLVADGTPIDATGTTRRLQALIAIGWPQAKLAARLGWSPSNFHRLVSATQVTARTARAARAVYDDLWNTSPDETGHASRRAADCARNTARRNGWPPPMAWDDDTIDNPTATPDRARVRRASTIAIAENTIELTAQGYTRNQAAERLGVTVSTVNAALSYHRKRGTA
jgi:hypothetical protein